jgi:hypothetical protein
MSCKGIQQQRFHEVQRQKKRKFQWKNKRLSHQNNKAKQMAEWFNITKNWLV